MGLTGDAKRDYQRRYMERKRSNKGLTGSNNVTPPESIGDSTNYIYDPTVPKVQEDVPTLPQRTKGRTPEESGYPAGQVDVRTGPQGQQLWRLNGHYDMPNSVLCFHATKNTYNPAWAGNVT